MFSGIYDISTISASVSTQSILSLVSLRYPGAAPAKLLHPQALYLRVQDENLRVGDSKVAIKTMVSIFSSWTSHDVGTRRHVA